MRLILCLLLAAITAPALAQRPAAAQPAAARAPSRAAATPDTIAIDTPSPCAALPETGLVAVPAPPMIVPAQPTPERGWRCPDDYRLDLQGRLPVCRGGLAAGPGTPRALCYRQLAFGPLAPLPDRRRAGPSCPKAPAVTVLALRGSNIGWRDVTVAARPADDVQLTSLFDAGAKVAATENPVVRNCLAPDCRLVKLAVGPEAAAEIALVASLPGGAIAEQRLRLRRHCPPPER
jgi:hypothetical protein